MAVREILTYPDPRLRDKCVEVEEISDQVRSLLNDMAETMYQASGIGLAAAQVGAKERVIVVDLGRNEETGQVAKLYKLVNPKIIKKDGWTDSEEGCLSIPSIRETIQRFSQITVSALDEQGNPLQIEADGLLAICLQHEIDHLDGILFIDHLSRLKQHLIKSKLNKLSRQES